MHQARVSRIKASIRDRLKERDRPQMFIDDLMESDHAHDAAAVSIQRAARGWMARKGTPKAMPPPANRIPCFVHILSLNRGK